MSSNNTQIADALLSMATDAKQASFTLAQLSANQKNAFLVQLANTLRQESDRIIAANTIDITSAKQLNISQSVLDRLILTPESVEQIAREVCHIASLEDPIGKTIDGYVLDNGLKLERRRVPLGLVAVIYEARPNVTIDVASLCIKTGNAVILRGGKETQHTNAVLVDIIKETLIANNLPSTAVQAILDPDREWVNHLLKLDSHIDMLIPRGGASLHALCKANSTIPVIVGGIGVCHIYVDRSYVFNEKTAHALFSSEGMTQNNQFDFANTFAIIDNAKTQKPSACNSVETVLVDSAIADYLLPALFDFMTQRAVRLKVCPQSKTILLNAGVSNESFDEVTSQDYAEESLSLVLNVKVAASVDEAISHIRQYGTQHSDAILTKNMVQAEYFINAVDSAAVYVNASTRFTDGAQFGLGAEVAVSTQKLHARGPMGLEALTTYKWIGRGDHTVRQ